MPQNQATAGKRFWLSKTFWINLLAIIALVVQSYTGFVISLEAQTSILAALNVALRLMTKEPINWDVSHDKAQ
ncbi:hypothetical protein [Chrysiogenes arsenatis]|uniref:hypothetical protein n=1 Tax=Chrysiogenes arsenatis TaxID=309797 RepID=UPI000426E700|nr:hypothetical protein [Chrysiogenes arsenatis]